MKKIWENGRKWLINKLGGIDKYTIDEMPKQFEEIRYSSVKFVAYGYDYGAPDYTREEHIKKQLQYEIFKQIEDKNICEFHCDDVSPGERRYCMSLYIEIRDDDKYGY